MSYSAKKKSIYFTILLGIVAIMIMCTKEQNQTIDLLENDMELDFSLENESIQYETIKGIPRK